MCRKFQICIHLSSKCAHTTHCSISVCASLREYSHIHICLFTHYYECARVWPAGENKQCARLVKRKAPGLWNIYDTAHTGKEIKQRKREKKVPSIPYGTRMKYVTLTCTCVCVFVCVCVCVRRAFTMWVLIIICKC